MRIRLLLLPVILAASGCITVTARPNGGKLNEAEPTVTLDDVHYAGFGTPSFNAKQLCGDKKVDQIQYKQGWGIWIFDFSKARIWCKS